MIKNFIRFYELAVRAVKTSSDNKITWSRIRNQCKDQYTALTEMKFIPPLLDENQINQKLNDLYDNITKAFQDLIHS